MKKDYQEIVDEIFGEFYQHRTLRTLFDPGSEEWKQTTIDKKMEILKKILSLKKITLPEIIRGYKYFYLHEIESKKHVVDALPDGLALLLERSLR